MKTGSPDGLQLELHHRTTLQGTVFKVIINNMKLLCNFEWMIALKEFIATKPENPFLPGEWIQKPWLKCSSSIKPVVVQPGRGSLNIGYTDRIGCKLRS